jgi:hypothetical protein
MLAAFKTAGMILSARGLLAVCLFGAFILAMTAMLIGGIKPLIALGLYGVFTIGPLVWLESRRAHLP